MKIYKDLEQGSEEWFKVRLGKLTASRAAAIATNGKGLETLCFEKVAELITNKFPEQYKNADMERGNLLEPKARIAYEFETENIVEQVGFVELDAKSGCSPDGLIEKDGLVEIKCPKDHVYIRYLYDGKAESNYVWQMQMQMLVCERDWCDYVVFNENFGDPVITRIERDDKKIEKIKIGLESGINKISEIMEKINE